MLLLTETTDKLQLTTSAAATVDVHASWMDASDASPPVVDGASSGRQHTAITTATTTDIVASPAANRTRNVKTLHIRNKHASTSTDVTVLFDQNGTDFELHKVNLSPGEALEYVEGIGFFEVAVTPNTAVGTNKSTAAQGPGFSSDTYVVGSALSLAALGAPVIGLTYELVFIVSKTSAGTATPIITVRVGTAGTTGDTSRVAFTFAAGTAAADQVRVEIDCMFRAVGANAVLQGVCSAIKNLSTTGWSNAGGVRETTSGTFDATVANSIVGVSYNGGTSAVHTISQVSAKWCRY